MLVIETTAVALINGWMPGRIPLSIRPHHGVGIVYPHGAKLAACGRRMRAISGSNCRTRGSAEHWRGDRRVGGPASTSIQHEHRQHPESTATSIRDRTPHLIMCKHTQFVHHSISPPGARLLPLQAGSHPSIIGSSTPSPSTNSHSAGAGVPIGRLRRASRAAMRGSSSSQSWCRRSSSKKANAVAAP